LYHTVTHSGCSYLHIHENHEMTSIIFITQNNGQLNAHIQEYLNILQTRSTFHTQIKIPNTDLFIKVA